MLDLDGHQVAHRIRARPARDGLRLIAMTGLGEAACLLADVRMPGISGMTLLDRLSEAGVDIPSIVITA